MANMFQKVANVSTRNTSLTYTVACCSDVLFCLNLGDPPEPMSVNLIPLLWDMRQTSNIYACNQEVLTC